MSVCLSVRPFLKISVTTEPIGFYSSGNIPTGPVVVLGYFLGEWDTPNPPKNKKSPPFFLQGISLVLFLQGISLVLLRISSKFFLSPLGAKPLEARCEVASVLKQYHAPFIALILQVCHPCFFDIYQGSNGIRQWPIN